MPLAFISFRFPTANVRLLEIYQVERSIRFVEFIHCGGRQLRKSTRGRLLFMPGGSKKGAPDIFDGRRGKGSKKISEVW